MKYVDGFVIPVPKKKLKNYMAIAKKAGKVWLDHGALQYFECAGDDLDSPFGTSFPKTAKAKGSETVVFSFIVYKSRAHLDKVNEKVMKDPRIASMDPKSMPFDLKRMVFGGFKALVEV